MSSRVKWISAIVGLLTFNVVAMVTLAVAANDGETQVIPAYYEKAAHYDDALDQAQKNHDLGWHANVTLTGDRVEVAVRDATGAPLDGAKVQVTGYQRAHANQAIALDLVGVGNGTYRAMTHARAGVHDLTTTVEYRGAVFTQHAAIDVP